MANLKIFINRGVFLRGLNKLLMDDTALYKSCRQHHLHTFKSKNSLYRNICNIERKNFPQISLISTRFNSTETAVVDNILQRLPAIPEPPEPVPVVPIEEAVQQSLNALGEPTFASLGLGGWSPVGMIENSLEFLHVTFDIPWWGAIFIGTAVLRTCLFPVVVLAQRNAAKMHNTMPQMQILQLKMTEARKTGNRLEAARYAQEMMMFMKEKNMNPFLNMIPPLAQMPVFISMFWSLRSMSNLPVESLRTGGLYWFTDLTIPDQFYILPILTSLTLLCTIELGVDATKVAHLGMMRYVLRALPFVIFPFTINFPGTVLCYWLSSNVISLGQVALLKIPKVRAYCKIEPLIDHPKESFINQNKGFVGGVKESITNLKITNEVAAREHADEIRFKRAGRDPVRRTFKYDPTKVEAKKQT